MQAAGRRLVALCQSRKLGIYATRLVKQKIQYKHREFASMLDTEFELIILHVLLIDILFSFRVLLRYPPDFQL